MNDGVLHSVSTLPKTGRTFIAVSVLVLFGVVAVRATWLSVAFGEAKAAAVARQEPRANPPTARLAAAETRPLRVAVPMEARPRRGTIFDRTGRPLAISAWKHRLLFNPSLYDTGPIEAAIAARGDTTPTASEQRRMDRMRKVRRDIEYALPRFLTAEKIRFDEKELLARVRGNRDPKTGKPIKEVVLARDVSPTSRRRLLEAFRLRAEADKDLDWNGFMFDDVVFREYPWGAAVAQVLGMVAESPDPRDGGRVAGRSGMEWQLDRVLEGRPGQVLEERDGLNTPFRDEIAFATAPIQGGDVTLTIDAEIQRTLIDEMEKQAKEFPCAKASTVVLDARTGDILGIASWPSTTPYAKDFKAERLQLGAASDSYEPGSTIKPIVVSTALERGVIREDERFECGGADGTEFFLGRKVTEYSTNPSPLTAQEILWRSSNVGATRIGLHRLGLPGLFDAFGRFKLRGRPGSGLPHETAGWYTPQVAPKGSGLASATESGAGVSFPRGYEIRLSPLHLATTYTVFATGGDRVAPNIIREIRYGDSIIQPAPRVDRDVVGDSAVAYVAEGMRQVIENPRGTAHRTGFSQKYTMMGKTGTAQYADRDTARGTAYNTWFCGVAPAHEPRIVVCTVFHKVIRTGKGYTGGVISAPVARTVVERTLEIMGVPPDRETPPVDAVRVPR